MYFINDDSLHSAAEVIINDGDLSAIAFNKDHFHHQPRPPTDIIVLSSCSSVIHFGKHKYFISVRFRLVIRTD